MSKHLKKATFAAGCFWRIETAFRKVDGVVSAVVGYIGGTTGNPTYKEVCSGRTGHAEAVEVEFDPDKVSYGELLELFWRIHDPTTLHRQGPDIGTQYRSAVFVHDADQQAAAESSKSALDTAGRFASPIVTEIVPAGTFYRAEEYHQRHDEKLGVAGCRF